jgi:hypothetical protein
MSQQPITAVVTWLSGVFTPSMTAALSRALSDGDRPVNWLAMPGAAAKVEDWITGRCSNPDFWAAVQVISGSRYTADQLAQRFTELTRPDLKALPVLQEIPKSYTQWLLCDLPGNLPAELNELYPQECILSLPEAGLRRLLPEVFDLTARQAGCPLRECLFIDSDHKRAVRALRHGASVGLYVNPRRLRREFVLRRMLDVPLPSHVPGGNVAVQEKR